MAIGLERYDEVWAELNDLPSPYYLRQAELFKLQMEQITEQIQETLAQICKYNICRPREFFEWSYVVEPADLSIPSGGSDVQQ